MIKTNISKKHAEESLALTETIIEECGPRLCGTEACKKSAFRIKSEMEKHCDSSGIEEFDVHPKAFLGFMKTSVILYLASSILLFFGYLIPAALGYTLSVVITVSQFVFYLQIFDPFYKKKTVYLSSFVFDPTDAATDRDPKINGGGGWAYDSQTGRICADYKSTDTTVGAPIDTSWGAAYNVW